MCVICATENYTMPIEFGKLPIYIYTTVNQTICQYDEVTSSWHIEYAET